MRDKEMCVRVCVCLCMYVHIQYVCMTKEVKFIANFVEKLCGKNIQIMMQLNAC